MTQEYVLDLQDASATLGAVGGKGASLARLAAAGLPVPAGFHVTTAAYRQFVAENGLQPAILAALQAADPAQPATLEAAAQAIAALFASAPVPPEIAGAVVRAYGALPGSNPAVAVRSSATAEDLPEASFAGQQETYLNVAGPDAVLEATRKCWASLWTARAIGYRARRGIAPEDVALAVVVQLLVPAEAAGVLFTADPVSGRRDRAVISAAWGLGESVVGGQVTPDTVVVDTAAGRVERRETAEKQVMTVRVDGGTALQPVPEALRRAPVLGDEAAVELAQLAGRIEALYGMPMDIEWALCDGKLAIVQARPITALPEPAAAPPGEWALPEPKGQYMRASIIDFLPDPLTPLFATLGVQAMNGAMLRLVAYIGQSEHVAFPEETVVTIHGYAYMKTRYTPREWWWLLTRLVPGFPRMLRTGIAHWRDEVRPAYAETVSRWQARPPAGMAPSEILAGVREVLDAAMDHLGSLMAGTMGAAAGSEMLFTRVYEKLARQEGDPPAPAFLMGYDSVPIRAEKSLYDLAAWCRAREALAGYLLGTPAEALAACYASEQAPESVDAEDWQDFGRRLHEHLKRFGHTVYDLDFAKPLPLDDPAPVLEACRMYLRGEGADPYERQQRLEARRIEATETMLSRLKGLRLWAFRKALGWAQAQAEVREDAIADIGLGYPLLRRMLGELGRRFSEAGAIAVPGDIYWLTEAEVEAAAADLERGQAPAGMAAPVRQRRAEWQAARHVSPPPTLPPTEKYLGINVDVFIGTGDTGQAGDLLKGVGASAGCVTGPARVLRGPEDFDQMRPGEVLVATITTPAWTPLFAMASAVVTDIGGPLSHGSIVAREYGIPAVLGTGVATRRIHSGQILTVDGGAGTVVLIRDA